MLTSRLATKIHQQLRFLTNWLRLSKAHGNPAFWLDKPMICSSNLKANFQKVSCPVMKHKDLSSVLRAVNVSAGWLLPGRVSRDLWPFHFLLGLAGLASSAGSIWSGVSPLMEKSRAARSVSVPPHFKPRDISSSFRTSRPRDWSWSTDDTEDRSSRDRPPCCCWGDKHQTSLMFHVREIFRSFQISNQHFISINMWKSRCPTESQIKVNLHQLHLSSWAELTARCRAAS